MKKGETKVASGGGRRGRHGTRTGGGAGEATLGEVEAGGSRRVEAGSSRC
jgi:hypothetical protein